MGKHTVVCGANRAMGSTAAKLTAEQHSSTTAAASAGGDTAFVSAVIMMGPIPVRLWGASAVQRWRYVQEWFHRSRVRHKWR